MSIFEVVHRERRAKEEVGSVISCQLHEVTQKHWTEEPKKPQHFRWIEKSSIWILYYSSSIKLSSYKEYKSNSI